MPQDIRDIQINLYQEQQQTILKGLQNMLPHTEEGQSKENAEWSLRILRHSLMNMIQAISR